MTTQDKLDKATQWLAGLAPLILNKRTLPMPMRALADELELDFRAWMKSETKEESDVRKIRAEMSARDAAALDAFKKKQESEKLVWGPQKWRDLHTRALAVGGVNDDAWLQAFAMGLPCGECKAHFIEHLRKLPPDFTRYFEWTVDIHNAVNVSLGKPTMTIEAARKLYS